MLIRTCEMSSIDPSMLVVYSKYLFEGRMVEDKKKSTCSISVSSESLSKVKGDGGGGQKFCTESDRTTGGLFVELITE